MINNAQINSLLRSALKWGGGFLVAHGVTENSVTQWVIGIVPSVVGLLWSHFAHAATSSVTTPPTTTTTGPTK